MKTLAVETTEGVAIPLEVAGAGARGLAALVDLFLCMCVTLIVSVASLVAASGDPTGLSQFAAGFVLGGGLLSYVAYHALFLALWDGRTPGKALLGLRVRDAQGHPARPSQMLMRSLFLLVEILPLPIPIGFAILAASARRQRLGDVVADTLVLRDPRAGTEPGGARTERDAPGTGRSAAAWTPAIAARFGPEDRELLRAFLSRLGLESREWLEPDARRALTRAVASHCAARAGFTLPRGEAATLELLEELYRDLCARR